MEPENWISRLWSTLRTQAQEYDQVQGEATMETLHRFQWLVRFAVPLHLVLAAWFSTYQAPPGQHALAEWARGLYALHGVTGLFVLMLAVFVRWLLRPQTRAERGAVVLQVFLCLTYLCFGVLASIIDLRVAAPGGISPYITVCIIVGVISLMRPALSLPIFAVAFVLFWVLIWASDLGHDMLPSLVINSVSTTFLATLTSLLIWRQYAKNVLLRRQLSNANQVLEAKQKQLETLAERDVLTGLYNRHMFLRLGEIELARTLRFPSGTCLLMLDPDGFKDINDQYGNAVGDQVLQEVAKVLEMGVRSVDVVARMGGDKFVILLPNTTPQGGIALAEKLRIALRMHAFQIGGFTLELTTSVGVSGVDVQVRSSIEALYTAADRAVYAAKQAGRDRVAFNAPKAMPQASSFDRFRA